MSGEMERLRGLLRVEKDEEVIPQVEKVLVEYQYLLHMVSRMGAVTLIVSPEGLAHLVASPSLLQTQDGLTMLERAVLDLQSLILTQKRELQKVQDGKHGNQS